MQTTGKCPSPNCHVSLLSRSELESKTDFFLTSKTTQALTSYPFLFATCSIIKVWDRNTLRLQASLHGHFDFITDIDISKCNRFIASAGKDAQVIIWDLKLGRIVKRLTDH